MAWCDSGGSAASWHVRTALVDSSGEPGTSFVVGSGAVPECWPTATRHADGYLVAWIDMEGNVLARRIDPNGALLDDPPKVLGQSLAGDSVGDTVYITDPSLGAAWNGTMSLVAWSGSKGALGAAAELRAVRITKDGQLLDSTPLTIAPSFVAPTFGRLAVAGNDEGFVVGYASVGWAGSGSMHVSHVGADGTVEPVFEANATTVSLLRDGAGFLAAWVSSDDGTKISLARLGADGHVCHQPWTVEMASPGAELHAPQLFRHSGGVGVIWGVLGDDRDAVWRMSRLRPDYLDAVNDVSLGEVSRRPVAASAGGSVLVAYERAREPSGREVVLRTIP